MRINVKPVTIQVNNYHRSFGLRIAVEHRIRDLQEVIRCLTAEMTRDEQEELAELEQVLVDLQNWI